MRDKQKSKIAMQAYCLWYASGMEPHLSLRSVNHNLVPLLRALLRERSVTRAAETMGLTQPAVSATLARLRIALNDPLLVKSGRGLALSPRGEVLLPMVEDLCIRLEQLWMRPDFQPATSERCFTLTSPDFIQVILAPGLIDTLSARAPNMSLRFLDAPVDDVTRHKINDFDFIISIRQALQHPAMVDFVVTRLYEDLTVAVVGPRHRLFAAEAVTRDDYAHDRFVVFVGGAHFLEKRYDELRNAIGSPERPMMVSQHYNSLMMIAMQAEVVGLIPRSLARLAARTMGLRILDDAQSSFPIEVCLAWDRRHEPDQAHRWLGEQIKAVAAQVDR